MTQEPSSIDLDEDGSFLFISTSRATRLAKRVVSFTIVKWYNTFLAGL